ncbi:unnamed protein product [Caenorhabditis sp. 36 PRJEB53466]|nr:unnamed protein product [Caenorhabditis sp. 36 PRJEB53466]
MSRDSPADSGSLSEKKRFENHLRILLISWLRDAKIPFAMVDNPRFRDIIHHLNPKIDPPSFSSLLQMAALDNDKFQTYDSVLKYDVLREKIEKESGINYPVDSESSNLLDPSKFVFGSRTYLPLNLKELPTVEEYKVGHYEAKSGLINWPCIVCLKRHNWNKVRTVTAGEAVIFMFVCVAEGVYPLEVAQKLCALKQTKCCVEHFIPVYEATLRRIGIKHPNQIDNVDIHLLSDALAIVRSIKDVDKHTADAREKYVKPFRTSLNSFLKNYQPKAVFPAVHYVEKMKRKRASQEAPQLRSPPPQPSGPVTTQLASPMPKITTALIDLSGTLHVEELAIAGAQTALEVLRSHVAVKFVTNTTKESQNLLHQRLQKCGFRIEKHEIFTSLCAARDLILKNRYRPFFMLDEKAMEDFEGIPTDDPNAVVIGLAPEKFNDSTMTEAFRLIKENNAALIAIHKGRYYQKKDGLHLGPGAYVAGLEYATGVQAKIVGKPERLFFQMALETLSTPADFSSAVMIGDDVNDDVLGAVEAGMRGILVKTGKYRSGDEDKVQNVADSFVQAVEMIIANRVE